ncbi:MAG: hypothetical protein HY270_04235 [Deltaproteobacteria bacterium]|nr:hypothetical protein [Deltaproteobacteria bacterium]
MLRLCRIAAALFTLIFAACGNDGETDVSLTSAMVLRGGKAGVAVSKRFFEDVSRPTNPNRGAPGSPTRQFVTEIWYPTDWIENPDPLGQRDAPLRATGRPFPLLLYAHSFGLFRGDTAYLARQLASYGYIVVAPDFPLSKFGTPGGPNLADIINQPGDISFLIDQMTALNADRNSIFAEAIDLQHIGVYGYSLGAATAYLVTFDRAFIDTRIRAIAVLASVGCNFTPEFFAQREVPLLIMQGDIDSQAPYTQNSVFAFHNAHAPKYLMTLKNGSHAGFAEGLEQFLTSDNPDSLNCRPNQPPPPPVNLFDVAQTTDSTLIRGDCPGSCRMLPLPPAMKPPRQRQLAILGLVPYFEASLRHSRAARMFLQHTLMVENPDAMLQFDD